MIGRVRTRTAETPYAAGVVLAGGSGARMGAGMNKAYLPLAGRRLVSWSLAAFDRVQDIGVLLLVVRPEDRKLVDWVLDRELPDVPVEVVHGGDTRQDSELQALRRLASRVDDGSVDVILLHDAARPLVSPALISGVLHAARQHGGAVPGLPAEDVVTVGPDDTVQDTHPIGSTIRAQTPQGFVAAPLIEAYEHAARESISCTDTASCMERYSTVPVHWVHGDERNFKITYPHDLTIAEQLLAASEYRT